MPVLLLRLAGPMQSWGTASRFSLRDTCLQPSKSGVIGLLCAAVGIPREDDDTVARLAGLSMGVRVDREGQLARDFHTIGGGPASRGGYGVARARGVRGGTVISQRHYLADADFLVGLESADRHLLETLDAALERPVWPLCLGRRSFVPGLPPRVGVVDGPLEQTLREWPWQPRDDASPPAGGLRLVLEIGGPEGEVCCDVPVSFAHDRRQFRLRYVETLWIPPEEPRREPRSSTCLA